MKGINKLKLATVSILVVCLFLGVFLLINEYQKSDNITQPASNKIKSNQETPVNIVTKDELLTLVNSENKVPEDWQVDLVSIGNNQSVDRRIYNDLMAMIEAAQNKGLSPLICSSYRTNEKQTNLYQKKVDEYLTMGSSNEEAKTKAAFWVARPGTSEHQLGWAVDIVSTKNQRLDKSQENTPEQKWLMANSWKYGFILRYPTEKSSITNVGYEPWHYRYVGKEHAKKITELKVCLEEYVK